MDKKREILSIKHVICLLFTVILLGGLMCMFTSCEREDISGSDESQTGLKPPTGPPVIVNFTVEERQPLTPSNGEEEKEAPSNLSDGGKMEKTATRSAPLQMQPNNLASPDFANALYFSPPSGELEGTLDGASLYLSSSIEENAPSVTLRAMPLDPYIKVRVVAYNTALVPNDTLIGYADYEVDAGNNLVPYGTAPLTVPSLGNIHFIAYSFNADTLPPYSATISNIGCYDLIYVADTVYVGSSNMTVNLTLEHLFSKIQLVVDAQLNSGNSIDTIYGARYNHTYPDLFVRTGNLTPAVTMGQIPFISNAPGSTGNPWNSKEQYVYLPPPAPPSIVVTIDSVTIDTDTYKKSPTPPWTIDYGTALEPGKKYTLNVYFSPSCVPVTDVLLGASPTSADVGTTTTLTATVTPYGAANVSYTWEVFTPAGWMPLATTSTNTYTATIINVGENVFRVTASNSCNTTPPPLPSATTIVQGNAVNPPSGSAARITWEPASATYPAGRYIITYDPRDAGLYFKFGSVVAIYSDGGGKNKDLTPPAASGTVPFNAANDLPWNFVNATNWATVPYANPTVDITANYHLANVASGRGDPCRLVGLDLATIQSNLSSLTYSMVDNGIWRLPTYAENGLFTGTGWAAPYTLHWWSENQPGNISYGVAGGEFPERNLGGMLKFLPAAGVRNGGPTDEGEAGYYGTQGSYWSSVPEPGFTTTGYAMHFQPIGVFWSGASQQFAYPIRCVYDLVGPCTAVTGISPINSSEGTTVGSTVTHTTLTVTVTPTVATNVTYTWEAYNAALDTWNVIGTNSSSVSAAIMTIGENKFRVTVTNACTVTPQTANITITRTSPPTPIEGSAARITWEPPSSTYPAGRYAITYDPRDAGLYFRFGSVVGVYSGKAENQYLVPPIVPNIDPFDYQDVAWTPEPSGTTYSSFNLVPYAPYTGQIDATFHVAANLKAGLGDPCRLVGLDLNWIKNSLSSSETDRNKFDNGTWRLPTQYDNEMFIGATSIGDPSQYWWNMLESGNISFGMSGGEFPKNSGGVFKFLPASGYRAIADGTVQDQTTGGYYWSNEGGIGQADIISIDAHEATPTANIAVDHALPVRCVYDPNTLIVSPTTTWSPNAIPQTSTQFTVTTNQPTWNAVSDASSWCTVSTSSGSSGGNFTITVTANDGAERTAHITLTAGYAVPVTVTVTQGPCIPLTSISSLSVSPSGTQPVGTSISITVTPTPSNATNLVYAWEFDFGSGWYPVLGGTGNQLAVPATPTPTQYRVTVSNGCSSPITTAPVTITGSGAPPDDKGMLPDGDILSYVGAFWRATESGERVIRIDLGSSANNYGSWTVFAVEYDGRWDPTSGDGIMFAPGTSADPYIFTTSVGDAEDYKLSSLPGGSYSPYVGGTTSADNRIIEFRIFPQKSFQSTGKYQADHATNPALDANYTTTWPARYAVVYLTYGVRPGVNGKRQNIYLRQGEGSDYVMYDQGSASPWVHPDGTIRPYARRFSPYNLTDPYFNAQPNYDNMTSVYDGLVQVKGGIFVDYPTKGGYYFMHNLSRRAFNPWVTQITNWPTSNPTVTAWNPSADETCPAGYKRPSNGAIVAANTFDYSQNEMTQSLLLDIIIQNTNQITPSNTTWGYYADGWFDRREIVQSGMPISRPYPTVVWLGNKDVAHAGLMFFSAKTKAHLFLPMAGDRSNYDPSSVLGGLLERFGYWGYYASTTNFTSGTGGNSLSRNFRLGSSTSLSGVYIGGSMSSLAMSIRCIRE